MLQGKVVAHRPRGPKVAPTVSLVNPVLWSVSDGPPPITDVKYFPFTCSDCTPFGTLELGMASV